MILTGPSLAIYFFEKEIYAMKTIIKILSFLPAIAVGLSSIILFMLSMDYIWMVILSILDMIGFIYLLDNKSYIERNLYRLFRILY